MVYQMLRSFLMQMVVIFYSFTSLQNLEFPPSAFHVVQSHVTPPGVERTQIQTRATFKWKCSRLICRRSQPLQGLKLKRSQKYQYLGFIIDQK